MGVPAFFRWLSRKYSSIVIHCVEEKPKDIDGVTIPVDITKPNPNEIEFDNLYLDMNGIIHPCSHPEDRPAPKNEEEIMIAIFEAIDRLMSIVRPRRLLYMAIDGVAPRAKMNQQRSRRFRASKEGAESTKTKEEIIAGLRARGVFPLKDDPKVEKFDSNCITPGTGFMHRLAHCLRFYIIDRINNDPGWKSIEVILSDANVPGEGEHKIMDFIRRQRGQPDHDPNTHHCICGADADLIMLGLATHEPNFTIIREEFKPNQPKPCGICSQFGHDIDECQGLARNKSGEFDEIEKELGVQTSYIFIRLCVIREYLELEMKMPNLPIAYDFENVIDDWVMLCFFVGNDFLPHLPSLEIREGAIDKLVKLYKDIIYETKGYLTNNGIINLDRVEKIMQGIGKIEDEIFRRRRQSDLSYRAREKAKRQRTKTNPGPRYMPGGEYAPVALGPGRSAPAAVTNVKQAAKEMRTQNFQNQNAASSLRTSLKKGEASTSEPSTPIKRKIDEVDDDEPADEVRLWEEGWKERYFLSKFNVPLHDYEFRRKVVRSYVEGLCWVLLYYYQGCASWKWFFPFHYAPFASDFVDISDIPNTFPPTTKPKKPLEQLMCVFPAASGQFLPESWRKLMADSESPIIDFYPDDFRIDLNGKKYAWQGVALLPFVDEDRMMRALENVYPDLTEEEDLRNSLGNDYLFIGPHHPLHELFASLYEGGSPPSDFEDAVDMDPALTHGMAGKICKDKFCKPENRICPAPLPCLENITNNQVLSMSFKDPQYPKGHIFTSKLLPGAKFPPRTVKPSDLKEVKSWQPRLGFNPNRSRMKLDQSGHRHVQHHLPSRGPSSSYHTPHAPYGAPHRFRASDPRQGFWGPPQNSYQSTPFNYDGGYNRPRFSYNNRGGHGNDRPPQRMPSSYHGHERVQQNLRRGGRGGGSFSRY